MTEPGPLLTQTSGPGFDGTRLRYWIRRRGPSWLLVCNGYGSTAPAWLPLLRTLSSDWSILLWDYRGQFGSEAPQGDAPIPIGDHSRDLDALMAAESIERGVVMGWSVGVQVALEHYRRRPGSIQALVLINGAYEQVLHSPWGPGLGAHAMRAMVRAMGMAGTALRLAIRPLVGRREIAQAADLLGIIKGNPDYFLAAMTEWKDLDLKRYMSMTLAADEHRTSDMLETVNVPTLITCGDRDALTPPALAHEMHERIPGSDLFVIPDTTHYAILERPELIGHRIQQFLTRSVLSFSTD
ncbi:MAG: alpha/beta hydrolase [bacterium]